MLHSSPSIVSDGDEIRPHAEISFVLNPSTWALIRKRLNKDDRVLDVGCGGGTLLWNIESYTPAKGYGLELSSSRARITSATLRKGRVVCGNGARAPFPRESFELISCCQVIEHIHGRENFISCLYELLKPGGILVISSVRRAKHRLYYLRNERGETILESSHVHEFDSLTEFNHLVTSTSSKIIHSIEYPASFSILDFFLRRIHRLFRKPFTYDLPASRVGTAARKATRIPIPGYFYVESVALKNDV